MKKVINLVRNIGITGLLFSYLPSRALAAGDNDGNSVSGQSTSNSTGTAGMIEKMKKIDVVREGISGNQDVEGRVIDIINYGVGFLGLIAVVFLIIGGVQYMTAAGDEGKVEKATKTITNSLIGLAIVILSGLIVNFLLSNILKVK